MSVVVNSEHTKRKFAGQAMEWLDSIPESRHEWCDALIAAAIDECKGDLLKALDKAKQTYIEMPEPPEDEDKADNEDTYKPETQLDEGIAGYSSMPDVPTPMPKPPTKVVKVTNVLRDEEGKIIGTTVEEREVPIDDE